jgi:hypothetical protein
MHLRTLLWNEHRDLSSIFVNVQVSEAYIITGLTNVLYISSFVFHDTNWDHKVFLRPWNVLPADNIRFRISILTLFLQLISEPR